MGADLLMLCLTEGTGAERRVGFTVAMGLMSSPVPHGFVDVLFSGWGEFLSRIMSKIQNC